MAKKILLILILIISFVTGIAGANKKFTLVIDPGHGGRDSGAPGAFSVEKNINLNVALAFGRYVEQNCPDVRVVYTRKTDVFIPLYERANIANNCKADLFISVHTNALKRCTYSTWLRDIHARRRTLARQRNKPRSGKTRELSNIS